MNSKRQNLCIQHSNLSQDARGEGGGKKVTVMKLKFNLNEMEKI